MEKIKLKNLIKKLVKEQFRGAPGGTTPFGTGTNTYRQDAQRFRNDFVTNLVAKFGPPGATRINQIPQGPKREQAKSFIMKRKAALIAKQQSGRGRGAYHRQLLAKIQILSGILRNQF